MIRKKTIKHNISLPASLLSRFELLWLIQDRPDLENDKRLAEHIAYVHMKGREPEKEGMKPLDMSSIRRYVAVSKRKQPIIEEKLRDRLVDMYVDLRKDDLTFTSPRSLLAVIRLSTALARLRLSNTVESGDIDEAMFVLQIYLVGRSILKSFFLQSCCRKFLKYCLESKFRDTL